MIAVSGTYQNGFLKLEKEILSKDPVRVIVTFLDEIEPSTEKRLLFSDFSYSKSQKALEHFTGSLSDTLIEERRSEI